MDLITDVDHRLDALAREPTPMLVAEFPEATARS
jgi:hypothetical protein